MKVVINQFNKLKRQYLYTLIAGFGLVVAIAFQNCSQPTQFAKDYTSLTCENGAGGACECEKLEGDDKKLCEQNHNYYLINSRTVDLKVVFSPEFYDQMRASFKEDMGNEVAWIPVDPSLKNNQIINFDLGSEFAADGSKDGEKTVFVEYRDSKSNKPEALVKKQYTIFLDSQAPTINFPSDSVLQIGSNSRGFKKGASVDLKVEIFDPLPSTGQSKGLDKYKVAWTRSNCSDVDATDVSDWTSLRGESKLENISIIWPEEDPLNAFYFCVFVKDMAGSITARKSQVMTDLWEVLAGNPDSGNGGTKNATNLRLKKPNNLFFDPVSNLQFADVDYNMFREFNTRTGVVDISSKFKGSIEGRKHVHTKVVFDGRKRAFFIANAKLFMVVPTVIPSADGEKQEVEYDLTTAKLLVEGVSGGDGADLVIRRFNGKQRLIFNNWNTWLDPKSYLFEIPVLDIQDDGRIVIKKNVENVEIAKPTKPINTDFINAYRIYGNGLSPIQSTEFASDINASTVSNVGLGYSLGYAHRFAVSDDGREIYFVTNGIFENGQSYGHDGIRKLTVVLDAEGKEIGFTHKLLLSSKMSKTNKFLINGRNNDQPMETGTLFSWFAGLEYVQVKEKRALLISVRLDALAGNLLMLDLDQLDKGNTSGSIYPAVVDVDEVSGQQTIPLLFTEAQYSSLAFRYRYNKGEVSGFEIYAANKDKSQIYRFEYNDKVTDRLALKYIETIGREPFDTEINPLLSVLAYPTGLFVNGKADGSGQDIYLLDPQARQIRKISDNKDGTRTLTPIFDGSNQVSSLNKIWNNEPISEYNPNSWDMFWHGNHAYRITGDFGGNRQYLFVNNGGRVDRLDLSGEGTVKSVTTTPAEEGADYRWDVNNITSMSTYVEDDKPANLFVLRSEANGYNSAADAPAYVFDEKAHVVRKFVSTSAAQANFNSIEFLGTRRGGDPVLGTFYNKQVKMKWRNKYSLVHVDKRGYVYVSGRKSGYGGALRVSHLSGSNADRKTRVFDIGISEIFAVIEMDKPNADDVYDYTTLIYVNSDSQFLNKLDLKLHKSDPALSSIVGVSSKLCLSGLGKNIITEMKIDSDGNLIISDAGAGQIYKYRLRDKNGNLVFKTANPDGSCQ